MTPFIGEIAIFPYSFVPKYWAACSGQILSIQQNQALFSILGTTYGGDGQTTFALPNLNGRTPIHVGTLPGGGNYALGQIGGVSAVTLSAAQLPMHSHVVSAVSGVGNAESPSAGPLAQSSIRSNLYASVPNTSMAPVAVTQTGSGSAHNNMPPYLAMGFFIALQGVFPSRN